VYIGKPLKFTLRVYKRNLFKLASTFRPQICNHLFPLIRAAGAGKIQAAGGIFRCMYISSIDILALACSAYPQCCNALTTHPTEDGAQRSAVHWPWALCPFPLPFVRSAPGLRAKLRLCKRRELRCSVVPRFVDCLFKGSYND